MHPNTEYLMRWNDRMVKKFGQPETGWEVNIHKGVAASGIRA